MKAVGFENFERHWDVNINNVSFERIVGIKIPG